jgi:hypothetical protein
MFSMLSAEKPPAQPEPIPSFKPEPVHSDFQFSTPARPAEPPAQGGFRL